MAALPSIAEQITESFYAWELRGRGWQVAPYPVALEPPFRYCQILPQYETPSIPIDDGHRPTFLSSLFERALGRLSAPALPALPAPVDVVPFEERPPHQAELDDSLTTFRVLAAANHASNSEVAAYLLRALSTTLQPVSVELFGCAGTVSLQICCRSADREHVLSSLEGFVPEASVVPGADLVTEHWDDEHDAVVVDFGLSDEFFLPIRTFPSFKIDPYIALVAGLSRAGVNEWVCLQILFERVRNPWGKAITHALSAPDGSATFADAPEFLPLSREKTRTPLLASVVRVAALARSQARAFDLARGVGAFILQFERPGSNALLPLENDDYPGTLHAQAFRERTSNRTGMLLSIEELIGLVHIPDASVRQVAFLREDKRSKATPASALGHAYVLGENNHRGNRSLVSLDTTSRLQHVHVLGASGTGKSTLLLQLIIQDIRQGHGVAVLDPHGDLVDDVLARIPDGRQADVVVFDPADEECPVGLNVLSARTTLEKQLLASDLVGIFQRLSTSWGDTMGAVLSNAVLAILEHREGGTLLDLRRFLLDERFRREYLRGVADEEVQFFWTKGFPLIGTRSVGPILTRLDAFLRPKLIRHIVGQREPRCDLGTVMSGGQIFLAKLSQGLIGIENASLLGSLLATRLHQLALARQQTTRAARRPFFLYADEAQHFVTPSMAALLTDVRKYAFGLVLSHQNLFQIRGTPVESALLGNAFTRIAFRVGDEDAKKLAEGCSFFEAQDFRGRGRGEAIVRIGTADGDCNLQTLPLGDIDQVEADARRATILTASRTAFGMPLAEVQAVVAMAYGRADENQEAPAKPASKTLATEPVMEAPVTVPAPLPAPATVSLPLRTVPPGTPLPDLGRGGPKHKYLQHLVRRLAEERGFRATIEAPAGDGQVDVALQRDDLAIAIEISITTNIEHELRNVEKCVAAGFRHIALVCTDPRRTKSFEKALVERSDFPSSNAVRVLQADAVADYLDTFPAASASESTVRGYKVRINRQSQSPEDTANRRRQVAQTIARSLSKTTRP